MRHHRLLITLPLVLCAVLAALYRLDATALNVILAAIFGPPFSLLRAWCQSHFPLPGSIIYNLPSALWTWSLTLLGHRLLLPLPGGRRVPYRPIAITFVLLMEAVQYLGWSDGTFDRADITWSLAAYGSALLFLRFFATPPTAWSPARPRAYLIFWLLFFAVFLADIV